MHVRVNETWLGRAEKSALGWLVRRVPAWIKPDHLTALGFFACVLVCAAYALSHRSGGYLWLANLGFVLNWLGDSLDGTLARHRRIERPRYGYFLDHTVDSINMLLIALGLGFSPYVRLDVALFGVCGYFMVSILTYITTHVRGIFRLSYGGMGPTEVRLLLVGLNTAAALVGNPSARFAGLRFSAFDLATMAAATALIVIFVVSMARGARDLAEMDRPDPA